ncbi:MAG: hypothetical protein BGO37_06245 [Cellulomonas sp. 73-92]|uniref:hypothetical protein n=1 Tax=Cellulomonas sp. 73-92 TaxID=1895740 RepID=UPI00092AFE29|nr:hypothetical protein [Cellulomonas sp. 73-92]OJV81534.1 MAG: hypothetical protein BGO37_06245 [Cellulomonas sp. 73-92]
MADWSDVTRFVHSRYKAEDVSASLMKLLFNTAGLRSQIVFLEHATNDSGAQWVKVNSPIGTSAEVDVRRAAEIVADMLVGGIVVSGEYVYVTNAMPLQNLDANEIIEPLERVMSIADSIEAQLLGKDAV